MRMIILAYLWVILVTLTDVQNFTDALSSYKCTEEEAKSIAAQFFSRGGYDSSKCPKLDWIDTLAVNPDPSCGRRESNNMNILVVGGNKGYDCMGWARMFTKNSDLYDIEAWHRHLLELHGDYRWNSICGACDQCKKEAAYPISKVKPESVKVYCVEPVSKNMEMIKHALKADGNTLKDDGVIRAVNAAIGLHMDRSGTVPFIEQSLYGQENLHIMTSEDIKQNPSETLTHVPSMTVDTFIRERMDGHLPEVLTVDTEGFDPLVILGAASALASGHIKYLEFEYHSYKPWADMDLSHTVDFLDNLGYDCFWATNQGVLYRVTGCWDTRYSEHSWSNLVCAHRMHPCWHNALLHHEFKFN